MLCLRPASLNRRATLVPSPHPCRTRPPAQRVRASTHIMPFRELFWPPETGRSTHLNE